MYRPVSATVLCGRHRQVALSRSGCTTTAAACTGSVASLSIEYQVITGAEHDLYGFVTRVNFRARLLIRSSVDRHD